MARKLPTDCLNEIFEYLEDDKFTLHSCLLVNHLWCEISVRILWRNILNFKFHSKRSFKVEFSILSTLIACLPDESKKHLYDNKVFISTPTSKPLLFNYVSFCKALSIFGINRMIDNSLSSKDKSCLVANEIIKMFANQISSLKKLTYHNYCFDSYNNNYCISNITFPHFSGARDLLELCCNSNLSSDFFYQLSQICRNLQSISIDFNDNSVSNELKELISLQNNLKHLTLSAFDGSWADIIPAVSKHSRTITKLNFYGSNSNSTFSFISLFSNLQELIISFFDAVDFENFKKLQYVNFPKLQILKIPYERPKLEYIIKFLEINGKTLKKLYIGESDKDLGLSISKFCPNLKSLFIILKNDELDILKTVLINCQYLESIKIWYGKDYFIDYLPEKEIFETIAKYSPNNFCELKIFNYANSVISSDDLESFFIRWEKRIPKKLLSLIIIVNEGDNYYDNISSKILEVIEKYEDLGTVKFLTKSNDKEIKEEEEDYYYY
ncbi:unnamed protein product [Rhizophagus irregularis]|uniref:F-box domain-containing protein n=1 Tax=Rhizophagus irregularis TaxID=588596 RepID=A0A2N1NBE7_9GLOM|nr:hypothetical protein RhiirC2_778640 [Rhizophagus irregularis]CAB4387435.1 unnamed protein product [Rhizophagus irregularis]CAB5374982.1 unnamed protein product [Rhizophagus irregularis]